MWIGRKFVLTAVLAAITTYLTVRGERVIQFFASVTTLLGAFSVSEWGVIGGLILGLASFILTWVFKYKNHKLLVKRVAEDTAQASVLKEDDGE